MPARATSPPNGLLLGGVLRPAGVTTSFLRASFADVLSHLTDWRRSLGQTAIEHQIVFPDVVKALEPFEAPWTREVLFDCGEWTAYMNNDRHGGDPSSAAPYLAASMNIECFTQPMRPDTGRGTPRRAWRSSGQAVVRP